jgi:hypothetical protein
MTIGRTNERDEKIIREKRGTGIKVLNYYYVIIIIINLYLVYIPLIFHRVLRNDHTTMRRNFRRIV